MEIDVSEAFSFRCAFLASLLLQRVHLGNLKQNILSRDTEPVLTQPQFLKSRFEGTEFIYD